jgi:hypothetical protein
MGSKSCSRSASASHCCWRCCATTHLAALPDAFSAGEQITIIRLHQFNQGQSLGGISIAELRDHGRR